MTAGIRVILTVAACAPAMPVAAQAGQGTTRVRRPMAPGSSARMFGRRNSGKPAPLPAEQAVDKSYDCIEAAVVGEVLVSGLECKPALLRLGGGGEQGAAKAYRDDAVTLAVQDQ